MTPSSSVTSFVSSDLIVRNTVYFSRLDDLIDVPGRRPDEATKTPTRPICAVTNSKLEKSIGTEWKFIGSLSLQDYDDDELPPAVPWMFKLGTEYRFMPLTLQSICRSTASVNATARKSILRSDFEQTTQVDISLRSRNFLDVEWPRFPLGIRNLLDETLKYPAPVDTYADDYPYSDGAMLWAQFSYRP